LKTLSIFFLLAITVLNYAQNVNENAFFYSNNEQNRIDALDGKLDQTIDFGKPDATLRATFVYFNLVDSIENSIKNLKNATDGEKKNYIANLYLTLKNINDKNVGLLSFYEKLFAQIINVLQAKENNQLETELYRNVYASLQIIPFYKLAPETKPFLIAAASIYPDEVLKKYNEFADQSWAAEVIVETAKSSPLSIKKYLGSYQPIRQILNASQDSAIHIILRIYQKYGVKSNAYALTDGIYRHDYSLEKGDTIGKSDIRYLVNLLKLKKYNYILGNYSVDKELEYLALKYVRTVNELHDETDQKVRFQIVNNLMPEELYTLMVYSKEEIFTSTFLGLYNRMIEKMGSMKGDQLLKNVGFNKFRTFIRLCAGFNKLDDFLKTMNEEARKKMLQEFVKNLETNKGDLSAAVEVADAFGSITDSSSLHVIENSLLSEYKRVSSNENKEGKVIYGLLISLFKDKSVANKSSFIEISNRFQLPVIDRIAYKDLIDQDSLHLQIHFFFDDDDGKASFKSYIETFTVAGWTINKLEKYVEIKSKNNKVLILANYPETEETGGHEAMMTYCDTSGKTPDVMVHRGHSYYAMKTIEMVTSNTKVVFLGSCGGYNNLNEILDRSPDVQIIATKQIGTMAVNNPLLLLLASTISNGKDVKWAELWSNLEKSVKPNKAAYDRFTDYIPPYKNLGAIFIQAYRKQIRDKKE
jgi:hypothetical protein